MPKDRSKYRYFEVGLERTSWALAKLEEDAKEHHMSDQPGKLMALRLTEYYEQKERPPFQTSNHHQGPSAFLLHANEQKGSEEMVDPRREEIIEVSQNASANADEAADYWASL